MVIVTLIIHKIFSFAHDWSKCVTGLDLSQYPSDIPHFLKLRVLPNYIKNNEHNSLYLARNMFGYLSLDLAGLNLFLKARSFFLELRSRKIVRSSELINGHCLYVLTYILTIMTPLINNLVSTIAVIKCHQIHRITFKS